MGNNGPEFIENDPRDAQRQEHAGYDSRSPAPRVTGVHTGFGRHVGWSPRRDQACREYCRDGCTDHENRSVIPLVPLLPLQQGAKEERPQHYGKCVEDRQRVELETPSEQQNSAYGGRQQPEMQEIWRNMFVNPETNAGSKERFTMSGSGDLVYSIAEDAANGVEGHVVDGLAGDAPMQCGISDQICHDGGDVYLVVYVFMGDLGGSYRMPEQIPIARVMPDVQRHGHGHDDCRGARQLHAGSETLSPDESVEKQRGSGPGNDRIGGRLGQQRKSKRESATGQTPRRGAVDVSDREHHEGQRPERNKEDVLRAGTLHQPHGKRYG